MVGVVRVWECTAEECPAFDRTGFPSGLQSLPKGSCRALLAKGSSRALLRHGVSVTLLQIEGKGPWPRAWGRTCWMQGWVPSSRGRWPGKWDLVFKTPGIAAARHTDWTGALVPPPPWYVSLCSPCFSLSLSLQVP